MCVLCVHVCVCVCLCVCVCMRMCAQERSIVPSDANLFPDCDWLLGNHSDELTPWIPMMAAR